LEKSGEKTIEEKIIEEKRQRETPKEATFLGLDIFTGGNEIDSQ
jgi:hypothetical protein